MDVDVVAPVKFAPLALPNPTKEAMRVHQLSGHRRRPQEQEGVRFEEINGSRRPGSPRLQLVCLVTDYDTGQSVRLERPMIRKWSH